MYKGICVVILFICFYKSKAQNSPAYSDAGHWTTLSVDYSINKKWSIIAAEEIRFRENYSRLNLLFTNIGLEFNANKYVKSALVYRFINKLDDDNSFTFRHRLMWDIIAKYKYIRWSFLYRHMLQGEYRSYFTDEFGKLPEIYSRSKIEIGYNINKKWSTYLSAEMRYQIHDYKRIVSEDNWHRIRVQAGIDYKLNKYSKIGTYYLIQKAFNVANLENIYITGLEYSMSLKDSPLFKKKKK
jgi:hypothetical protein